jgi:hypothetical protein
MASAAAATAKASTPLPASAQLSAISEASMLKPAQTLQAQPSAAIPCPIERAARSGLTPDTWL